MIPPDCSHDENVSPYVQSQILLFLLKPAVTQLKVIFKLDKSTLCRLLWVIDEDN